MNNFQIHELSTGALDRDSNLVHDTEVSTDVWNTRKATAGAVADLASANVAAAYDSATTYAIGQYCLYEGDIYRCIAITTGAFDSTAWTQIVVTGEFRRVVELTSAQYTALSSAEKNNGTLYIITDEETTAADIPYSAGVSVADILDSLTTPTLVTQTPYSGITDNTEIYKITDKMYMISINITNPTATSSWVNICDFSAPSFSNQCFTAVSTETNDSTYCQCFYTSGKARLRISAPKASTYRGFMMLVIP